MKKMETTLFPSRRDVAKFVGIVGLGVLFFSWGEKRIEFDEARWRHQVSEIPPQQLYAHHHEEKYYFHPWFPAVEGSKVFPRWMLPRSQRVYSAAEQAFLPAVVPDALQRIAAMGGKDFILWIGHNTFLIRSGGVFWITDPVFSQRVLLSRRKRPPALTAKEINTLTDDLRVVITHNHYDHLDEASLKELISASEIYLPLGLGGLAGKCSKARIHEMDWWQEREAGLGMKVLCLPAQHWSRRAGQKTDTTLWASFLLQTAGATFYFGGDSGYFPGYREFGRFYGTIDFALLPLADSDPRWFMHPYTLDVEETLLAFEELGARYYIPTQWGTFQLGDEPPGYAALELKRKILERRLDPERFKIMAIGQILDLQEERGKDRTAK